MAEHPDEYDADIASREQTTVKSNIHAPPADLELDGTAVADADKANKPKRKPKEPVALERELGKSFFPVSRVQRILKADKELPMVSREAVLLISLATEEFVKRISEASHRLASRENRMTVQRKDIASVCRRAEEFMFLEELIPLYEPEMATKRKPKALQKDVNEEPQKRTFMDSYVLRPKADSEGPAGEETQGTADEDVVMNEDGTMTM